MKKARAVVPLKPSVNPFYVKSVSIILILALGLIVYSNTFRASFQLDDITSIINNSHIRNIGDLANIWNFLPRRFLLYLSLALNYHFHQLDVFGYHLVNLTIHLITALLVWWLVRLTFLTPVMRESKIAAQADLLALFAGLIFVSHPVQTEAVTYIVQRAASLATLFYVAALCFYARARLLEEEKPPSGQWKIYYAVSLLSVIAAMFTKETAITLPLMVLWYEISFLRRKDGLNWPRLIPFLLTLLIIPAAMFMTESKEALKLRGVFPEKPVGITSAQYLLTQFRVMITYLRLVFVPVNQNLDYDQRIFQSVLQWPVFLSFLSLAAIIAAAQRLFFKYRLVSFAILWFFLALLPESSILPIKDVIFEHRLYLPLVGFSLFLVSSAFYLLGTRRFKAMIAVFSMIVLTNAFLTYERNRVWQDNVTLWDDTVRKSPHKARPYCNRGVAYSNAGDFERALKDFTAAIALDPNYAEAYHSRGVVLGKQGKLKEAIADFTRAIDIEGALTAAYNNRGSAYGREGELDLAVRDFSRALMIDPNYAEAYKNRGIVYVMQGRVPDGILDFTRAVGSDPHYVEAYLNRGLIYGQEGRLQEAVSDLTRAIALDPSLAVAYQNRIVAYYGLKAYDQAWDDVMTMKARGYPLDPNVLEALKKASGRTF
jgi:protein O-mannosyl-transferase